MKTLHFIALLLIVNLLSYYNLSAQNSTIAYGNDNLSGKLELLATDFAAQRTYAWEITVPKNVPLKVSRTNNIYLDNLEVSVDNRVIPSLSSEGIAAGEYTVTEYSITGKIKIKMNPLSYSQSCLRSSNKKRTDHLAGISS